MKIKSLDRNTLILGLMAIGFFVYSCLRAAKLSMTHDESSTFMNSIDINLWACFFSSSCWGTANIHWLNSFLMQISVGLFGTDEFFIRLPNLLGHLIYLTYSILLVRSFSGRIWIMLGGFLILNANPYLLEFFSLARGYGLGCAFVMMSMYYLYRYLDHPRKLFLGLTFVGSILAVLSNFTFLNFFAVHLAGLGALSLLLLLKWEGKIPLIESNMLGNKAYMPLFFGGISTLLLTILLYYPIKFLRQLGEFQYGIDSLGVSYKHLIEDSNMGQGYFGAVTNEVLMWVYAILMFAALFMGISRLRKKRYGSLSIFYMMASAMMLLFLLALQVQYILFDTKFLVHRTALMVIPIAALPMYLFLEELLKSRMALALGLSLLLASFSLYHFSRVANLSGTREWYYDAETRNMIELMQEKAVEGEQIKLGVYWIYHPTSAFYKRVRELDFLEDIPYEKQLRKDAYYDYYFVEPGQVEQLHPDYEIEQKIGWIGVLCRRKNLSPSD
ncbi:MAG: hypothetical protein AAF696_16425 [Bacteroidota bacterium]